MTDILLNSLNAGQMSRKLRYRLDFDRRNKAVAGLKNANVLVQGGVQRRPGTELLFRDLVPGMLPQESGPSFSGGNLHEETIAFPSAGGTGSNHIVYFTNAISEQTGLSEPSSILVYDIETDTALDVTWRSGDTGEFGTGKPPPLIRDYVVLNDVIIFTAENDSLYSIERTFDTDNNAVFTIGKWEFSQPSAVLESNGFNTARLSAPLAYRPDNSFEGNRWNVDDYAYGVHPDYTTLRAYETTYNYTNRITAEDVGAFKMLLITSQKYSCHWQDTSPDRKLKLVNPDDLSSLTGNKWFLTNDDNGIQTPYETNNDTTDIGYIVIPNDSDFANTTTPDVADRYIAVLVQDTVSVGDVAVDTDDRWLPLHVLESDVDNVIANTPEIIHCFHKAAESDTVAKTGAHLIKIQGTEDQQASTIEVSGTGTYPLEDISGEPAFANGSMGWVYSAPDLRIRDLAFTTEYHEDWDSAIVIEDPVTPGEPYIVDLGMVLGDWEFRTAGNWTGTYEIQSKRGFNWTTEKIVTSAKDYNVIINDGYEGVYGIHYRILITLVTSPGVQAVRAGYTFSWDNYNCFYLSDPGAKALETFSTWYAEEPVFNFEAILFHQQRLWLTYRSEVYASAVNDIKQFANYGTPTDASAMSYKLADTRSSLINWLHVLGQDIIIGTDDAQWALRADTGVLTGNTSRAIKMTSYPTSLIRPINIGNEMVYVDKSKKRIYASVYDYTTETLSSDDITAYADDIFETGIKRISYDEIDKMLYVIKNDGVAVINYDRPQSIIAVSLMDIVGGDSADNITVDSIESIDSKIYMYSTEENYPYAGYALVSQVNSELTGDSYLSTYTSPFDASRVFPGNDCYYRHTHEKHFKRGILTREYFDANKGVNPAVLPNIPPELKEQYYTGQYSGAYFSGLEIMYPIALELDTFPIDFGVAGPDNTFGKVKNICEINVFSDNTAGGWCSWDKGVSTENYADGIYNDQTSEYYPEAESSYFIVPLFSAHDRDISLRIHEESPYRTTINGLMYNFSQGK